MHARLTTPLARTDGLIIEELGDELLVYDNELKHAHSLGADAARVWQACDGRKDAGALARELDLDSATVDQAIAQLADCQLFDTGPLTKDMMTRRGFTMRSVKVGAAAAALPLIVSIAAPTAAMAVTEKFCAGIAVSANGCGDCHKFGCCCCEPPGGTTKPCHADCITSPDCNIGTQPNCNGSTDNCKLHGG